MADVRPLRPDPVPAPAADVIGAGELERRRDRRLASESETARAGLDAQLIAREARLVPPLDLVADPLAPSLSELTKTATEALLEAERRLAAAQTVVREAQAQLSAERAARRVLELRLAVLSGEEAPAAPVAEPVELDSEPGPAPLVEAPGVAQPWLAGAIDRLLEERPAEAAAVLVELLRARALSARRKLDVDLEVAGLGWRRVTLAPGHAGVAPLAERRPRREASFRAHLDAWSLREMLVAGPSRRMRWQRRAMVEGTWRRHRALRSLGPVELDLGLLADAEVWIPALALYRAAAAAIEPSWTAGHDFAVVHDVSGPHAASLRIAVRSCERPRVSLAAADDPPPAARLATTEAAVQLGLAGRPAPPQDKPRASGDPAALAVLAGWLRRVATGA
jgi:hypothetical protein